MEDVKPTARERVEYWKTIISVQMHFNDLCIRTRWFGLTVIGTLATAGVILFQFKHLVFTMPFPPRWDLISLHIGQCVILAAALMLLAVYYLDRKYYYYLLMSSVHYGRVFEASDPTIKLMLLDRQSLEKYVPERAKNRFDRDFEFSSSSVGLTEYFLATVPSRVVFQSDKGFYLGISGALVLLFAVGFTVRA